MKFSIQDMFLATFAVALALLVWRLSGTIAQLETRAIVLRNELSTEKLNNDLLESHKQFHQASIDRFALIEATGKQAESEFCKLQERYSQIDPVDDQTVSLRTVPMLTDSVRGSRMSRIRVYVPSQRNVFLQLRVACTDHSFDEEVEAGHGSYYSEIVNGGPFQQALTVGWHDVDYETSAKAPGKPMTFNLFLDNQLLVTASWMPGRQGGSQLPLAALEQNNYSLLEPLPRIARVVLSEESDEPLTDKTIYNCLLLLLGDGPSDYLPFPAMKEEEIKP